MSWLDDKRDDPEGKNRAAEHSRRIEHAAQMRQGAFINHTPTPIDLRGSTAHSTSKLPALKGRILGAFMLVAGAALAYGANHLTADEQGLTVAEHLAQDANALCGQTLGKLKTPITPNGITTRHRCF